MKNSYLTITDQFCGAGGSSQGAREISRQLGGGLEVKLALNHWKLAIETHNTNFPDTLHDCTDISACDPRRYPKTDILITSPECTNHSLAKGKKRKSTVDLFTTLNPEEERSRATMWDVPRFAEYHGYELIIVENVVDARYWVQWDAWLLAMHLLGYKHKCVYLNSMFCHPTPQSRDRMYVVFWKKGNPSPNLDFCPQAWCPNCERDVLAVQVWRNTQKQWGKYRQQYDYRCSCGTVVEPYYYAAFNAIDWSLPAERIGDRSKPLAPNTVKRIEYGLKKYGRDPLIITTRYTSGIECRVRNAAHDVIPTQPGDQSHAFVGPMIVKSGFNHGPKSVVTTHHDTAILQPFIINTDHSKLDRCFDRSTGDAMRNQTTAQVAGVVVPFLVKNYQGHKKPVCPDDPLGTITTQDHHGVVGQPLIVENFGTSSARPVTERLGCVTAQGKYGLLTPDSFRAFLSYYYNGSNVVSSVSEGARTVSTRDRISLIQHQSPKIEDCTYRMLKPHEIQAAMAFGSDYVILGNSREKVKQLGNAVTPPVMKLLIERCIQTLK